MIQIDHDGNDAAIVVTKPIAMLLVRSTWRVKRKVAFVFIESQVKLAVQYHPQPFHDREILVASDGLAGFQPQDLVTANAWLQRSRRAPANLRERE